jgi:hypothetical protein
MFINDLFSASMKDNPPTCEGVHSASAYFDWSWKGCGFGQLSFHYNHEKWSCGTEMMGPEATRKLLHSFADFVADNLEGPIMEKRAAKRAANEETEKR